MGRKKPGPERAPALPPLSSLHERHPGLTRPICESYAEAASVALSRHHVPPVEFEVAHEEAACLREVAWPQPDERTQRAWANIDDTTCSGAYSLALAALEAEVGWVAISRAETRTGADYYVGPPELEDLEEAFRLEVSGTDRGDTPQVNRRLKVKVAQALAGKSDRPAIACVVGYELRRISMVRAVEEE